jgi:chemotaxis protein CheD
MVLLTRPGRVKTVLGSCVAITMRQRATGVSSIVHCLLPNAGIPFEALPPGECYRYVDSAVAHMLDGFARRGVRSRDLEVKLFGGSDNLEKLPGAGFFHVGSRNVASALEALWARGVAPVSQGVGGRRGRLIEFDTSTGNVLVKRLPGASAIDGRETV